MQHSTGFITASTKWPSSIVEICINELWRSIVPWQFLKSSCFADSGSCRHANSTTMLSTKLQFKIQISCQVQYTVQSQPGLLDKFLACHISGAASCKLTFPLQSLSFFSIIANRMFRRTNVICVVYSDFKKISIISFENFLQLSSWIITTRVHWWT